jgi:predicted kinase
LSAIFYSRSHGTLLEPLIRQYVEELAQAADVHIVTVHLHTERQLLWNRIQAR